MDSESCPEMGRERRAELLPDLPQVVRVGRRCECKDRKFSPRSVHYRGRGYPQPERLFGTLLARCVKDQRRGAGKDAARIVIGRDLGEKRQRCFHL